ncbi:hypothetical protein NKH57_01290 [Mesorhizobium sp. M1050]|uniref:hypothetical protein n=1 Tax=Mesorhizobium sp. M1050 TaxID=2957051 RepID=UPI00333C9A7E
MAERDATGQVARSARPIPGKTARSPSRPARSSPGCRRSAWCGIDGEALGELVFNNMNMMFIEFVKRDAAKIPELRAAIRRQNRILVAAIGFEMADLLS